MIAYPLVTGLVSSLSRGLASGSVESGGEVSESVQPTLDWNPASGSFGSTVGPTPAFSRASGATMIDVVGNVVQVGINVPRITYDPVTHECLGYLHEEQRTNYVLQSSNLASAPWASHLGVVATGNYSPSPIIGEMATRLVFPADESSKQYQNGIPAANGSVAVSVWVKCETGTAKIRLETYDGTGYLSSDFSVDTTWRRIVFIGTLIGVGQISLRNGSDGLARTVLCAGLQLEKGLFATSYIPTITAAGTRSRDVCLISGTDFTSFYSQLEGTIVVEYNPLFLNSQADTVIEIANNSRLIADVQTVQGKSSAWHYSAGWVIQATFDNQKSGKRNLAFAYKQNDFAFCPEGGAVETDTSGNVVGLMQKMQIGDVTSSGQIMTSLVSRIRFYPKRLSNSTLINLTQP